MRVRKLIASALTMKRAAFARLFVALTRKIDYPKSWIPPNKWMGVWTEMLSGKKLLVPLNC